MTLASISEIANIVIAGAAVIALWQLRLTKQTNSLNSKRESIKYATQLVNDYLSKVVELSTKSYELEKKSGLKKYKGKDRLIKFTEHELAGTSSEMREHYKHALSTIAHNHELLSAHLREMNAREYFATPFIAGVADESVAFRAIGRTYCFSVQDLYYEYCSVRKQSHGDYSYFDNTVALYKLWSERLGKNALEKIQEETLAQLSQMPNSSITPIGV